MFLEPEYIKRDVNKVEIKTVIGIAARRDELGIKDFWLQNWKKLMVNKQLKNIGKKNKTLENKRPPIDASLNTFQSISYLWVCNFLFNCFYP